MQVLLAQVPLQSLILGSSCDKDVAPQDLKSFGFLNQNLISIFFVIVANSFIHDDGYFSWEHYATTSIVTFGRSLLSQ